MPDFASKNKQAFVFVPGKRKYLLFADSSGLSEIAPILETVRAHHLSFESRSPADFQSEQPLKTYLTEQKIGTYLYIAGNWAWMKELVQVAADAGFTIEEMQFKGLGPLRKKIFCSHCYAIFPIDHQSETICPECGVALTASSHYSRLHDAYLGYMKIL